MKTPQLPDSPRLCQNPDCDNHLTGRVTQKFCNDICKNVVKNARNNAKNNAKRKQILNKTCIVCGKTFSTSHSSQIICKDACRSKRHKEQLNANSDLVVSLIYKLRFDFMELASKDDQNIFADNLIEQFIVDTHVRQAFHRYKSFPLNYQFQYNPMKPRPSRSEMKNRYCVIFHEVIEDDTVSEEISIFFDHVPSLRADKFIPSYSWSTFCGSYKTEAAAMTRLAEIQQIMDYEDERSELLSGYRLAEHDRSEAVVKLEELDRQMDVFTYTEQRCLIENGFSLNEYADNFDNPNLKRDSDFPED